MGSKRNSLRSKDEQLYMLEVFIDQLNFNSDQNIDAGELQVSIKFMDLEPFEISAPGKSSKDTNIQKQNENPNGLIDFKCGKSCLFTKTPNSLVKKMKSMPMCIYVYSEKSNILQNGNRSALCATEASTPACMCGYATVSKKEFNGLSAPCIIKNNYDLVDAKGKKSATISVILRLSCFGSSIVTHFSLQEKCFMLQNLPLGEDLLCPNYLDKNITCPQNDSLTKQLLKRPASPPRISINEPGFETLTTAEKLNDPKYRSLIYSAYPNEPTCFCLPTDRSTHPMICGSACSGACCMRLRNPEMLFKKMKITNQHTPPVHTYCVDSLQSKLSSIKNDSACCESARLRGGADIQQIYVGPKYSWTDCDPEYAWYDNKITSELRREGGGGEYEKYCCSGGAPMAGFRETTPRDGDVSLNIQSACRPNSRTANSSQAGCTCPGKELSVSRRGNTKCTKSPCMGVDCLIRAFKEAQEFVDNIGKVPGLAGLGLMDPSESPFFGRDIDGDYAPLDLHVDKRKGHPATVSPTMMNPQCTAPCNTQIGRNITGMDSIPSPYSAATPLTVAVPGRTGIVREAIPAMPDTSSIITSVKLKKKEEKIDKQKEMDTGSTLAMDIDVGPCGEPKCKSRRKKPPDSTVVHEVAESPQKKPELHVKQQNTSTPKTGSRVSEKTKSLKNKLSLVGPGGDRNLPKMPVKVSRKIMRYIYTIGDAYPGINYGHKNCVNPRIRVPGNMGWLWNTRSMVGKLKPRIGWKPGAIGRYLNEILKEAKAGSFQEASRPRSVPSRSRRGKAYKSMSFASVKKIQTKKEGEEEVEAPPTLHIHRKDGTYYVTMYPIKQGTSDLPQLEEPMKPLQFKIVKNKDDASIASSSTASDMEIEFSPPAAVNRYRKKPDVIHVDTQVRQQEILDAFKPPDALKKKEKKAKKEKKGKK